MPATDPLWYKDAVIYQVHVRAFCDSTGDGVGDFTGLAGKLAYIRDLGVSCIWLMPFYPSPLRDDGYDIAHYEGVHPSYGTLKDFRAFLRAAHDAGLQVITELVINHTSDQHPWFQAARRAPDGSSKRDFYVWSDDPRRYEQARVIFSDTESSNWAWDPVAQAHYWHRFFSHQPDLNYDNPRVTRAVTKVMRFWLDMGVDGMRLDAVPYLVEREGTNCESLPETHAVLKSLRRAMDEKHTHRLLLAEANQWPGDVRAYFGDGDECHMAFHFPLMPRIYMALKQEDRHPIVDIVTQTPDLPDTCQWAIFLRNHDELTLEMVTNEERDYMRDAYANDSQMRVNGGIRRRLAPLLENDRQRIELLNSLLFSLPGTPIVYYGDEIGMGDNIYLGDRNGVRTPMQWTSDRNAGFSKADPARLYAPPIMDAIYGYQAVNVEAQERSPSSLLHWMRRLVALRRRHRTFGRGTIRFLAPANRKVLVYVREYEGEKILCVANLSRHPQPVELDLAGYTTRVPVEMLGGTEFPRIGESPYPVTLGPYGSYWFLLQEFVEPPPTARPVPRSAPKPPDALDLRPLLLGLDWSSAFDTATHEILERDYLPVHLATRRWFASGTRRLRTVRIRDHIRLSDGAEPAFVTLLDVTFDDAATETYLLPVGFLAGDAAEALLRESPDLVIARVSGARTGVLHERLDQGVVQQMLGAVREGTTAAGLYGRLVGSTGPAAWPADLNIDSVTRLNAEQRNTSFIAGERVIAKVIRRVEPGLHPELEIGRHLTGRVPFDGVPALLGALEYRGQRRAPHHLDGRPRLRAASRHGLGAGDGRAGPVLRGRRGLERHARTRLARGSRSHRVVRGCRQATRASDGPAASSAGHAGRRRRVRAGAIDSHGPRPSAGIAARRHSEGRAGHPHARRLSPWPAAGPGRRVHDRGFRGRCRAEHRRQASTSLAARRRGRDAALVRARGRYGPGDVDRTPHRTRRPTACMGPGLGGRRSGPVPAELPGICRPGVVSGG